ncbi:MAG: hypothetical protein DHS20C15_19830 [Planctomycetota bacterium]|nr:MAG: hypothetical protein DHS20C15_19830 [Planctomycetota bacterium]
MLRTLTLLTALSFAAGCVTVEEGRASLVSQNIAGHVPRWDELPDDGVLRDQDEPDRELVLSAQRLEQQGRWSDARQLWNELEARGAADSSVLVAQVRTLHAQGFSQQAAALLEREWKLRPDDSELALAAGDAWLAAGKVDAALVAYRAAAEALPDDRRARHAILSTLLLADRPHEVVAEFETLSVAQVPLHLLLHIGRAGLVSGAYDLATQCFSLWISEHPADQDAWVDLARASVLSGDHASAASALASARSIDPSHPRLALLSGHVAYLAGDQSQALRLYAIAAEQGVDPLGLLMRFWTPSAVQSTADAGAHLAPQRNAELTRQRGVRPRQRED